MSEYKYTIPTIPPSNNKYIGRDNRWGYRDIKRQWAQIIKAHCHPKPPAPLKSAVVIIEYHFKDKRRRDPDNYSGKMILDGLIAAGIIADDSFQCIDLRLSAVFGGENAAYTQITITERE